MDNFLGEFEVKLDDKKRIVLPAGLKKQLGEMNRFVVNRAFDHCLNLYPYPVWERVDQELSKLNPFVKKTRDFARFVRGGATELNLDASNRLSLPKRLLEYANISGSMIMLGNGTLIEIWDLATYETLLNISPDDFSDLAEDVMLAFQKEESEKAPNFDSSIIVPIIQNKMK